MQSCWISPLMLLQLLCIVSAEQTDAENLPAAPVAPSPEDVHAVLRELTVQISLMKRDNQEQAAELKELKQQKSELSTEVDGLKQRLQVTQVAFSASLVASGSHTFGPYRTHITLVFKRVVTNIGNAYNPSTGVFTAPVRGAYHFEWYIGVHGGSHATSVVLFKNSHHIFIAFEHQTSGYGSSSNGAALLLEAGDAVFLRLWSNYKLFDDLYHHTTFSGHLLFPM